MSGCAATAEYEHHCLQGHMGKILKGDAMLASWLDQEGVCCSVLMLFLVTEIGGCCKWLAVHTRVTEESQNGKHTVQLAVDMELIVTQMLMVLSW